MCVCPCVCVFSSRGLACGSGWAFCSKCGKRHCGRGFSMLHLTVTRRDFQRRLRTLVV